jgi:hypothetical protein
VVGITRGEVCFGPAAPEASASGEDALAPQGLVAAVEDLGDGSRCRRRARPGTQLVAITAGSDEG